MELDENTWQELSEVRSVIDAVICLPKWDQIREPGPPLTRAVDAAAVEPVYPCICSSCSPEFLILMCMLGLSGPPLWSSFYRALVQKHLYLKQLLKITHLHAMLCLKMIADS